MLDSVIRLSSVGLFVSCLAWFSGACGVKNPQPPTDQIVMETTTTTSEVSTETSDKELEIKDVMKEECVTTTSSEVLESSTTE